SMGSPNVITGNLPQARVGDMLVCVGPPDVIAKGSSGVFVNNMPAARLGDQTAHGGVIVVGLPTVLIGETGGGSAGGAPAPATGVALAFAAFEAQVKLMIEAAMSGTPFCEVCFEKAVAKLQANLGA
ncbi:MAG TPA: PAAR domain-containing protein, partial [Rhizomicrobium sp.]